MKYTEAGYRAIYHTACYFTMDEVFENLTKEIPQFEYATGVLTYGYYSLQEGFLLEVLSLAKKEFNGGFSFYQGEACETKRLTVNVMDVQNTEFEFVTVDMSLFGGKFDNKLRLLNNFEPNRDIVMSRKMAFLDEFRHGRNMDLLTVFLVNDEAQSELAMVQLRALGNHYFIGTLQNEPEKDFGCHRGALIGFYLHKTEKGKSLLIADLGKMRYSVKDMLSSGKVLEAGIAEYHVSKTEDSLFYVLNILKNSCVWVPCRAMFGEATVKEMQKIYDNANGDLESLKGMQITNQDDIKLIPDILKHEKGLFLPAFSSENEMGEYGKRFSKVEKTFLEVIQMARETEQELKGIVINAFGISFVIEEPLYDVIINVKNLLL